MRCRVWATPQAVAQALTADAWWRENRTASPEMFYREITGATGLLPTLPRLAGATWKRMYQGYAVCFCEPAPFR